MKTKLTLVALAFVMTAFFAAPAQAQTTHAKHTATVPFAFTAGDVQLPAGTYAITQFDNRMQLRLIDGNKAAIVTALPFQGRGTYEASGLHFERKGEEFVLSNVYFAGGHEGVELLNKKVRAASRM
jgi:hypothetical protein